MTAAGKPRPRRRGQRNYSYLTTKQIKGNLMREATRAAFEEALLNTDPASALRVGLENGNLDRLLPEIRTEMDFVQRTRYHHLTNLEHSLATTTAMPAVLDERLAGLFHDIGKRRTTTIKERNGEEQYLGHAPVGARMARAIFTRLGYEATLVDRVCGWIAHHMDLHSASNNGHSAKAQAKLLAKIGPDLEVLIRLQLADIGAMHPAIASEKRDEALRYHDMLRATWAASKR